jgi:hypothetical protein
LLTFIKSITYEFFCGSLQQSTFGFHTLHAKTRLKPTGSTNQESSGECNPRDCDARHALPEVPPSNQNCAGVAEA